MTTVIAELTAVGFRDGEGVVQFTVVTDTNETICLEGRHEDGELCLFESEAHRLDEWCIERGFTYLQGELDVEFEMEV